MLQVALRAAVGPMLHCRVHGLAVQVAHNIKQGEPILRQLPVSCGIRLTQQNLSRNQLAVVESDPRTGKVCLLRVGPLMPLSAGVFLQQWSPALTQTTSTAPLQTLLQCSPFAKPAPAQPLCKACSSARDNAWQGAAVCQQSSHKAVACVASQKLPA